MKLGLVGLTNVGKSTLFNAITKAGAVSGNYLFCTIEPNIGIVDVPDERLTVLGKLYNTQKITPASIEFVDIAGLVKGASKGEGLGNKFLGHIREVDAIVHVVRCFENGNITHVDGTVNPKRDIETINLELILADIESVDKKLEKANKLAKTNDKAAAKEAELLKRIKTALMQEKPARSLSFAEEEKPIADSFFLLTSKPVIYAANIAEADINKKPEDIPLLEEVINTAKAENAEWVAISCKIEEELASLPEDEKMMFKQELGITESGLDKLIKASYNLLGLTSFLTAGEKEVRAWTILKGTKAPQAAGKIHTDFEKGFIRAEIVKYDDLVKLGNFVNAKEHGKMASVGKEYIMQDNDVVLFKFNV